ncbi:glycosyltransferase family 9 protein [Dokdonella sp.]|uniref:glycosyltransferase family 9 protein n=1 Tax=Dokdonella sp. TaxID=2291710 RepID=UPI003526FEBB
MLTPVLAALHRDYPGAQVDAIVSGQGSAAVFADFPNFNSAFELPRSAWLHPWSWFRVVRSIRRQRYDLAIDSVPDCAGRRPILLRCSSSRRVCIGGH